jgi:hypothetical protein
MRASIGTTVAGVLFFLTAIAHADPPPAAPAPPPPGYAPPPSDYAPPFAPVLAPPLKYPDYVYIPRAEGASPALPGMPKRIWYGWQTLLVLGGSTALGLSTTLGGGVSGSSGVALVGGSIGGAGLLFGGPIVHWVHGNTARGFVALGINFGAPVLGSGLGIGVACAAGACSGSSQGFGILGGIVFGGSAGFIAALIVDVTALSYETKVPDETSARYKAPQWTLVPDLKITREKTTFGVAGVF